MNVPLLGVNLEMADNLEQARRRCGCTNTKVTKGKVRSTARTTAQNEAQKGCTALRGAPGWRRVTCIEAGHHFANVVEPIHERLLRGEPTMDLTHQLRAPTIGQGARWTFEHVNISKMLTSAMPLRQASGMRA